MKRFIARHQFSDYRFNPHFRHHYLMRGAVASHQDYQRYIEAMYQGMGTGQNMADPEVIAEALREHGLSADDIVAAVQDPKIKQELRTIPAASAWRLGSSTFLSGMKCFSAKTATELRRKSSARCARRLTLPGRSISPVRLAREMNSLIVISTRSRLPLDSRV